MSFEGKCCVDQINADVVSGSYGFRKVREK